MTAESLSGFPAEALGRARHVTLAVFDVDGVMTDGTLLLGEDGREHKAFNIKDGHGLRMLQHYGIRAAVISGRESPVVARRMDELGIASVLQGCQDKRPALDGLLGQLGVSAEAVAYVGDDVVDLPAMRAVGLAVAVRDAHARVRQHAHWVTANAGGRGAVREVCELILEARGQLSTALAHYLG